VRPEPVFISNWQGICLASLRKHSPAGVKASFCLLRSNSFVPFIFQIVNLTAQRRLRYMQAFCGPTDVQFLGDSHKNVGGHPPEEALLADLRLVYPQRPNVKVESARHFVSFQQAAKDFEELSQTKLTMPVLTVGGEKANGALLGEQTKIVTSDVTVIVLENTGHWVLEERPKETTDALMKFQ
jgi:pimeloyl-ACP methyl ester carboxylesterase